MSIVRKANNPDEGPIDGALVQAAARDLLFFAEQQSKTQKDSEALIESKEEYWAVVEHVGLFDYRAGLLTPTIHGGFLFEWRGKTKKDALRALNRAYLYKLVESGMPQDLARYRAARAVFKEAD